MEFKHEEKNTPTFRVWSKANKDISNYKIDILRIFCNPEWRAITFVTEDFKISKKFSTAKEYDSSFKGIRKIVSSHCRAFITVIDSERADISLIVASDADESPSRFEQDDLGFVKQA